MKYDNGPWECVSKEAYVQAERSADLHNSMGEPDEPATSAFSNTRNGRTVRGMMGFLYHARRAAR